MLKTLRTIALCLAGFVLLAFGLFVVNQTVQIVDLADRVDPRLGVGVLWLLLVAYAILLLTPLYLWLRLPPALAPAGMVLGATRCQLETMTRAPFSRASSPR